MLMVFGCCASFFRRKRHQIHCEQGHFTVKSFTRNSFGSRDYFFWTPKTNVVGWWMVFFLVNKTNWMWPCLMSTVLCWLHTTNISWHRLSFACISTSFCLMRFEYTKKCMEKVSNQAESESIFETINWKFTQSSTLF